MSPAAKAGFFLPLGDLPGGDVSSSASAVSSDGRVVVGVDRAALDDVQAFRWTGGGGLAPLGDLAGGDFRSIAAGISGDGLVIVGNGDNAGGEVAVRWTSGTGFVALGHLPGGGVFSSASATSTDGSVIVGTSDSAAAGGEAFRWTALGGMVGLGGLLGWTYSFALGVSGSGEHVVGYSDQPIGYLAFRWSDVGGMEGLGDLPGGPVASIARAISADGSLVVGNSESAIGDEAFLWTPVDGMRRLKDVLETDHGLDLSGWTLIEARDISDNGLYVVGKALDADGGTQAFLAYLGAGDGVDVPAPGVLVLFGASVASLAAMRARRRSPPGDTRRDVALV